MELNLKSKVSHSVDESMRGLSAVFVDGNRVFIDNGAIHAKSNIEKGLQFVKTLEELPNPRELWVVWITLKRHPSKDQGYYGAMPFRLWIDDEAKMGYKSLSEQVNQMDKAVKGHVDLSAMPEEVRSRLKGFLRKVREDLWTHAFPSFLEALGEKPAEKPSGENDPGGR